MSDDDGISNLSLPEYTEEDFREIDRLCEASRQNDIGVVHGAPSSSTELLQAADDGISKIKEEIQTNNESPFAQFRKKRGYLSVTDLVSPAWCEVQFDYGLRQLRSKPVEKRPQSFVSSKGKTINVKKKVAVKNEKVMDKGKTVHRELEREIHKEEVRVKVKTKEEMWALHLIDFLVRLKSGKTTSVCREIPVWGIIHDHAIFGVIDELRSETNPDASEPDSRLGKRQVQTKMDSFLLRAKDIMHASSSPPRVILHIVDNKTRYSPSLPSHVDTLPSRLQIMLYWLLLNQALSRNGTSFSSFCARTGADPSREFSEKFITKVSALVLESELSLHFLDVKCLQDMDFPYRETIKDMGLDEEGCISRRLSLVYRLRGRTTEKSVPASAAAVADKTKRAQVQLENSVAVREVTDEPIIAVDEGEGKLPPPMDGTVESEEAVQQEVSSKTAEGESQVGPEGTETTASRSRKRKRQESRESSISTSKSASETPEEASVEESGVSSDDADTDLPSRPSPFILGVKKFQYDEILLDAHLTSILAWWHGKRPPHGVSIEDVGRCNSCEYKSGCEWREQKALESLEKARAKSAQRMDGTVA